MEQNVRIVRVTDRESFKLLEAFQTTVWGRGDVIPYHVLIAFQEIGGIVLVAYNEYNRPIGLLCGYNSFKDGEAFYYMHLCGVLPEYVNTDLPALLRIAVREHLLEEGISQAIWLIDPLDAFEAYTSIHRLGGVGKEYMRNFYGLMRDPHNRGLESDRLVIKWDLVSEGVEEKICGRSIDDKGKLDIDNLEKSIVTVRDGAFKRILDYRLNLNINRFCLEIPTDIELMKRRDLSIAIEWRETTRKIFEQYLRKGYLITEMVKDSKNNCFYYIFEKKISGKS